MLRIKPRASGIQANEHTNSNTGLSLLFYNFLKKLKIDFSFIQYILTIVSPLSTPLRPLNLPSLHCSSTPNLFPFQKKAGPQETTQKTKKRLDSPE